MPKTKGMTSLEIAVIVAIVLVIAVAVGWYVYTTFVASTTGQPRLNVVSAEIDTKGNIKLVVTNPGPIDVQIHSIEIAGNVVTQFTVEGDKAQGKIIRVGGQAIIKSDKGPTGLAAGTMVPGRVILSGGQSFPFNAIVRPA
ncbi:MAG: class III signal peptide [Pyrobaculum sp.]